MKTGLGAEDSDSTFGCICLRLVLRFDTQADCSIAKFIGKNSASNPGVESMLDTEYITGIAEGVTTWVYSYPSMDFCSDLLTWAGDVAGESPHPNVVSLSYGLSPFT